jgi:uncharacterized protein
MAAAHPQVLRVILFGSFARGDYGIRSDLDLLVILKESAELVSERLADFLQDGFGYSTDIVPLTEAELESRPEEGDPLLRRAMGEGILLYAK